MMKGNRRDRKLRRCGIQHGTDPPAWPVKGCRVDNLQAMEAPVAGDRKCDLDGIRGFAVCEAVYPPAIDPRRLIPDYCCRVLREKPSGVKKKPCSISYLEMF